MPRVYIDEAKHQKTLFQYVHSGPCFWGETDRGVQIQSEFEFRPQNSLEGEWQKSVPIHLKDEEVIWEGSGRALKRRALLDEIAFLEMELEVVTQDDPARAEEIRGDMEVSD